MLANTCSLIYVTCKSSSPAALWGHPECFYLTDAKVECLYYKDITLMETADQSALRTEAALKLEHEIFSMRR